MKTSRKTTDLKRYIKYFWHNEHILEAYGMGSSKEELQKIYNSAIKKLSELESNRLN